MNDKTMTENFWIGGKDLKIWREKEIGKSCW